MSEFAELRRRVEEQGIESVDFRIADLAGRFRHITIPSSRFTEQLMVDGLGFDGSNYGYRNVAGSDMVLLPDLATAYVEERQGERLLVLLADICEAETRQPASIDPRGIAAAAVRYLREEGIADDVLVSPEFEFYVFDDIAYCNDRGHMSVEISAAEGNGHRAGCGLGDSVHSAYHAALPGDRLFGLRCDIVRQIERAGIPVKYHHHEVGAFGQQEIELGFDSLFRMADATLVVKSIVHNSAAECGMVATFLPKPMHGEAGNGFHLHQYLVRDGANLFCGDEDLSEVARRYVGGLLTHGRSLMAWTNPSTNSYRRLVPGYEAPVNMVYGAANRSAAVRVPTYAKGEATRIELRTMDSTCNPYLAFAAILMAGIDGIRKGVDARERGLGPFDTNQYQSDPGRLVPRDLLAPRDLDQALDALEEDHEYLLAGNVFTEQGIAHWIRGKRSEADAVSVRPHPYEFALYADL
ncbi:type I glutamate--ammonia ligase [Candidatus Bipolaricaulota bacterium]|nr:type I glutamate--ammonia ligase [Candidatus Bipolaricaulota bacterium]